ncbi:MAG: phosphoglycerate kinase [Saprospiraceae bacterium]
MKIDFKDKTALVRVDFNVPLNKDYEITDDTRMRSALPTIKQILSQGGAAILCSHLGRPGKKTKEDGSIDVERFTLQHLVAHLADLTGAEVLFCGETVGAKATEMAAALKPGQILLLENTRFNAGEKKGDPTFAKALADLADVYINDAFGTAHRAHASTTTVANYFTAENKSFGLLLAKEIENASKVLNTPEHPFTAIVGGAKVSDKILLLEKMVEFVDNIIVGGGMAYTFMKAQGGSIGNSLLEEDRLETARQLLETAKAKGVNIYLPEDSIIADDFAADANSKEASSMDVPDGWMGLDIGTKARAAFSKVIKDSKMIIWNGPMGVFEMEKFANGTLTIANAVAEATENGAFSLVGGGDSVSAVNKSGLSDQISFVSTGGGAMLEFLEGKELPGVKAIKD